MQLYLVYSPTITPMGDDYNGPGDPFACVAEVEAKNKRAAIMAAYKMREFEEWRDEAKDLMIAPFMRLKADLIEPEEKVTREPIETAPKDGTPIVGIDEDGSEDVIRWSEERYCMLGRRCGSYPDGWESIDAGFLPVDAPPFWRHVDDSETWGDVSGSLISDEQREADFG